MGFRVVRPEGFRFPGVGRPPASGVHQGGPGAQRVGIAGVDIKRAANKLTIKIHTSRPGMVIGQKGKKIEDLRAAWRSWWAGSWLSTCKRCANPRSTPNCG